MSLTTIFAKNAGKLLAVAVLKQVVGLDIDTATLLAEPLGDVLEKYSGDYVAGQDAAAFFNRIGRDLAKKLAEFVEEGEKPLSKERIEMLTSIFADALEAHVMPLLIETNLDRPTFVARLSNIEIAADQLDERERARVHQALRLAGEMIFDSATKIPNFTQETMGAVLANTDGIRKDIIQLADGVQKAYEVSYGVQQGERAAEFEKSYRIAVTGRLNRIQLFGVPMVEDYEQPLDTAYISLRARHFHQNNNAPDGGEQWDKMLQERERVVQSVEEAMAVHKRMFVTGGAGAGKTTLLKRIAVYAAGQRLPEQLNNWHGRIPFYLRLRDYSEKNLPKIDDLPLALEETSLSTVPQGWVEGKFRGGSAVLLVDGFDELSDERQREAFRWVDELIAQYPDVVYVLSGRPSALRANMMGQRLARHDFAEIELLPMNEEQIGQFVNYWYEAMGADSCLLLAEKKSRLPEQRRALVQGIDRSAGLRRLAKTPLLCALICALHQKGVKVMGNDAAKLYEAGIDMLLEARDVDKGVDRTSYGTLPSMAGWTAVLRELAYQMMDKDITTIGAPDLIHYLGELEGFDEERLARYLAERANLIEQYGNGDGAQYEFVHRSLMEYLAAKAIVHRRISNTEWFRKQWAKTNWHETLKFVMLLGNEKHQEELLEALLDVPSWAKAGDRERAVAIWNEKTERFNRTVRETTDEEAQLEPHRTAILLYDLIVKPTSRMIELRDQHLKKLVRSDEDNFVEIDLDGLPISRISWLTTLPQVQKLDLSNTAVTDVEPLHGLKQLWMLNLRSTAVTDVEPLRSLKQLECLDLMYTAVTDVEPLRGLEQLKVLELRNTAVSDVKGLSGLAQLQGLDLSNTAVTDVEPLRSLKQLTLLVLSNTVVADVEPLRGLEELEWLELRNTAITDVEPLRGLEQLRMLDLSNTAVTDVKPLRGLKQLEMLDLSNTKVSQKDIAMLRSALPNTIIYG